MSRSWKPWALVAAVGLLVVVLAVLLALRLRPSAENGGVEVRAEPKTEDEKKVRDRILRAATWPEDRAADVRIISWGPHSETKRMKYRHIRVRYEGRLLRLSRDWGIWDAEFTFWGDTMIQADPINFTSLELK